MQQATVAMDWERKSYLLLILDHRKQRGLDTVVILKVNGRRPSSADGNGRWHYFEP